MIMTARPHPPGDTEVMRNNESYWSGLIVLATHSNNNYNQLAFYPIGNNDSLKEE